MAKPKKLYFVETVKNRVNRTWTKGGGKYTHLEHARKAKDDIEIRGGEAKIFETQCDWIEVE